MDVRRTRDARTERLERSMREIKERHDADASYRPSVSGSHLVEDPQLTGGRTFVNHVLGIFECRGLGWRYSTNLWWPLRSRQMILLYNLSLLFSFQRLCGLLQSEFLMILFISILDF